MMETLTGNAILHKAELTDIFREQWQNDCEIMTGWTDRLGRESAVVIRYRRRDCDEYNEHSRSVAAQKAKDAGHAGYSYGTCGEYVFLRYSKGPALGVFWDVYGDDFLNVGLAVRAILEAKCPMLHYVPDSRIGL